MPPLFCHLSHKYVPVKAGGQTWVFYTHPLDKEFTKLYEVEFTIIDDSLFGCTYYFENDVYVQSLIVSIPSIKTKEVSFIYNEAEYGDDVDFEGALNPGTYNNLTKNISFKENDILKEETKYSKIKDNCGDLINYYLSTVKIFTSYDLIKLGYGSFQG